MVHAGRARRFRFGLLLLACLILTFAIGNSTLAQPDPGDGNAPGWGGVHAQAPNLQVTVTGPGAAVSICGSAAFTVQVANTGPDPATNVAISSSMPTGFTPSPQSETIGTIAAGGIVTRTYSFVAGCTAVAGDNVARVTYTEGAAITVNTAFTVNPGALTITKLAVKVNGAGITPTTAPAAHIGDLVTWRLTVNSTGLGPISNVEVTDIAGAGLAYVSSSPAGTLNGSNTTVWTPAEAPALAQIAAGNSATIDVVTRVINCAGLDNIARATWGCGSGYCLTQPQEVKASVALQLREPLLSFTPANASIAYCANSAAVGFTVQNVGAGPARNVFLGVDLGGYTVEVTSPGASYQTGANPGFVLPDIAAGDSYALSYILHYTGSWCSGSPATGTRTWSPRYEDDCAVPFYTPVRASTIGVAGGLPELQVTKTGASVVSLGQDVQYTVQVSWTGPNNCGSGTTSSITLTDTVPAGWVVVDADGGTVIGNQIVWTGLSSGASRQPTLHVPSFNESGCTLCGYSHSSTATASLVDCCGCTRTDTATVSTDVECPDSGRGLTSSRTVTSANNYEFCTPLTFRNTYVFTTDAQWDNVRWADMTFTEAKPAAQTYRSGTARVTLNGADVAFTVTDGAQLVIRPTDAMTVGATSGVRTLVVEYQLDTHPSTCASSASWDDWAALSIDITGDPGFGGPCTTLDNALTIRDVIGVSLQGSAMTVAVQGIPDMVSSCATYPITVTVNRTSAVPAYDAVLFLDTTNYALINVTGSGGVAPLTALAGTAVTGGFQWDYGDLFSGGNTTATLYITVQGRCLSSTTLPATIYYRNRCSDVASYTFPLSMASPDRACTATASDSGSTLAPLLTIYKFPELKWANGTQTVWHLYVLNSGAGEAHSVQLIDTMGNSQSFAGAVWSDATGVVTYTNQTPDLVAINGASWTIDRLLPGEHREVEVTASYAGCRDDTNSVTMQVKCLGAVCSGPVSDTSTLKFPPTNLVATSLAYTPISPCGTTDVVLTVRNAGLAPVFNIDLNVTLPAGLTYAAAPNARYQVNGGGYTGQGSSEPLSTSPLQWSYAQGASGLYGYLAKLDPGTTLEVRFTVNVACSFSQSTISFYAAYDDCASGGRTQTATNTFTVRPNRPVVSVTKAQSPAGKILCNGAVAWTVTVSNAALGTDNQPVTAQVVTLQDTLGAAFTLVDVLEGGTPVANRQVVGNVVTWEVANLAPGATRTFTVQATLGGDPCSTGLTNSVSATWGCGVADADPATAPTCSGTAVSASATVQRAQPSVTAALSATTLVSCSDNNTVTIRLTNSDTVAPARNPTLTINLPAGVTYVAGSASPAPSSSTASSLTYNAGSIADIPASGNTTITFQVNVACNTSGAITYSGSYQDCCNNSLTLSGSLTPTYHGATLTISKTPSSQAANPGDQVTWTIQVNNTSADATAGYVLIEDTLGTGFTYVSATDPAAGVGGHSASGQVVTWEIGGLGPGQSKTVTITATFVGTSNSCTATVRRNRVRAIWGCDRDANLDGNPTTTTDRDCQASTWTSYSDAYVTIPDLFFTATPTLTCNGDGSITVSGTVSNHNVNSRAASNVTVHVSVDGGAAVLITTIATINAGSTGSYSYTTGILPTGVSHSFALTIDSGATIPECNETNNTASTSTTCTLPTFTVAKSAPQVIRGGQTVANPTNVQPGDRLRYRLQITNSTGSTAYNLLITDLLPAPGGLFTYVAGSTAASWPGQASYTVDPTGTGVAGDPLTWAFGDVAPRGAVLANGQVFALTYDVQIGNAVGDGTTYTNSFTVTGQDGSGQSLAPRTATLDLPGAQPGLITTKTAPSVTRHGVSVANPTTVQPGDVVTFQLVVTNVGAANAYNVNLRDVLPAGMSYQPGSTSATWPGGSSTANPTPTGQQLDWSLNATLAGGTPTGGSVTLTFRATVDNATLTQGAIYTDNMSATGQTGASVAIPATSGLGDDTDPDDASTLTLTGALPGLTVAKAVTAVSTQSTLDGTVEPGDLVTFTVTVTNVGLGNAYGLVITDTLPAAGWQYVAGTTSATWPLGSSTANPATPAGNTLVWALNAQLNGGNPTGDVLTLRFRLRATSALALGANTDTVAVTGVDAGNRAIPAASGDTQDDNSTDTATATLTAQKPALNVDKTIARVLDRNGNPITPLPTTVEPGQRIEYQLVVNNVGTGLAYSVNITDVLPLGLATRPGTSTVDGVGVSDPAPIATRTYRYMLNRTIAAGGHITLVYQADVTSGITPGATLVNTATGYGVDGAGTAIAGANPALGDTADPDPDDTDADDTGSASIGAVFPALNIDKDIAAVYDRTGTLITPKPASVEAGMRIQYRVVITNTGTGTAYGVTIADTLPSGLTFRNGTATLNGAGIADPQGAPGPALSFAAVSQTLAAGQSMTLLFQANVTSIVQQGTPLTNTAHTSGADGANTAIPAANAALGDNADADPQSPNADDTGAETINPVVPALQVDKDITRVWDRDNALISPTPSSVEAGQTVEYRFRVWNIGGGTAYNVTITDTLPAGLTYVSGSSTVDGSTVADPGINGQTLTYPLNATLAANGLLTLNLQARVTSSMVAGPLTNVARARGQDGAGTAIPVANAAVSDTSDRDADSPNADDTGLQTVTGVVPALDIDKTIIGITNNAGTPITPTPSVVSPGDRVQYSVWVKNVGTGAAYAVTITDTLPAGLAYRPGTAALNGVPISDPFGAPGPALLFMGVSQRLAAGQAMTLSFVADVTSSVVQGVPLTNYAHTRGVDGSAAAIPVSNAVVGDTTDSDAQSPAADDTGTETIGTTVPALQVDKRISHVYGRTGAEILPKPASVAPGDTITYEIVVYNIGGGSAYHVNVTDTLPLGLTYVSITGTTLLNNSPIANPAGGAGPNLTFSLDTTILPGTHLTLSYRARVTSAIPAGALTNVAHAYGQDGAGNAIPFANSAVGDTSDPDADSPNADDTGVETVTGTRPALNVDKQLTGVYDSNGVLITPQPTRVQPGMRIAYQVVARSVGTAPAYHVTISDTLPAGLAYRQGTAALNGSPIADPAPTGAMQAFNGVDVTLQPGGVITLTFQANVTSSIVEGEDIPNYAQVLGYDGSNTRIPGANPDLGDTSDPDPDDPDADDIGRAQLSTAVPALVTDVQILGVSRGIGTSMIFPGAVITYQLTVSNVGLGTAYDVDLTNWLPGTAFTYVPGSTSATWPAGSSTADPQINGTQLTWSLGATLQGGTPAGQTLTLVFRAVLGNNFTGTPTFVDRMQATGVDYAGTPIIANSQDAEDNDPDDGDDVPIGGTKTDATLQVDPQCPQTCAGWSHTLVITYSNRTLIPLTQARIVVTAPVSTLILWPESSAGLTAVPGTSAGFWNLGTVPPGATVVRKLVLHLYSSIPNKTTLALRVLGTAWESDPQLHLEPMVVRNDGVCRGATPTPMPTDTPPPTATPTRSVTATATATPRPPTATPTTAASTATPSPTPTATRSGEAGWRRLAALPDYAPAGLPDFDMRQAGWKNVAGRWSHDAPAAAADALWWLDSRFESRPQEPPAISDSYGLVAAYGNWDDHDARNVNQEQTPGGAGGELVDNLALLVRTNATQKGTSVEDLEAGLRQYVAQKGLADAYNVRLVKSPSYGWAATAFGEGRNMLLLLGFWEWQPGADGGHWVRLGGHYVTVSGVQLAAQRVELSDPWLDASQTGQASGQAEAPLGHNLAVNVSHDVYAAVAANAPGGTWRLAGYAGAAAVANFSDLNRAAELESYRGVYGGGEVVTVVDYAVVVETRQNPLYYRYLPYLHR